MHPLAALRALQTQRDAGQADAHKLFSLGLVVEYIARQKTPPKVAVDIPLLISLKHSLQV